ncbi:uncharacterized protein LOC129759277 [Uranotaenia lowii]|uniref:uncharacterized protein LOC129759277 n=1 Tax=Uranotaenia lowii TaxID=190385 RepID=UPI002479327A|nr:uncharacterized protein LOC129759277 [Uranotaenia lowii]
MSETGVSSSPKRSNVTDGESCGLCRGVDTSRMVQCDECDKWFHYDCVNVDDSIEHKDWSCNSCVRKSLEREKSVLKEQTEELRRKQELWKQSQQQMQPEHTAKRSEKPEMEQQKPVESGQEQLQWHKHQQPSTSREQYPERHEINQQSPITNTGAIPKRFNHPSIPEVQRKQQGAEPLASSTARMATNSRCSYKCPSKTSRKRVKIQEFQSKALKARQSLEKRQLEECLELERQMLELEDSDADTTTDMDKVQEWLGSTDIFEEPNLKPVNETLLPGYTETPPKTGSVLKNNQIMRTERPDNEIPVTSFHLPASMSTPHRSELPRNLRDENNGYRNEPLNNSNLAARQTVKDLPRFGGDPEDWPRFIAAFERTSRMCAFRNDELLDRLERCLYDRAFSAVKCLLLHPDNVPIVINRLKTLFGNPDSIVDTMVKRVKQMPIPDADKLETMIDFGVAVQNLCATIQACRLDECMYDLTLLQELVEMLPTPIKMKWAYHLQKHGAATLLEFNGWIGRMVEAFSKVTRPRVSRKGQSKPKRDEVFLHVHTDEHSEDTIRRTCLACNEDCNNLEQCRRFQLMTIGARWSLIKDNNICRKCLTKHSKPCERKPCNKNGCNFLHHCLLHDDKKHKSSSSIDNPAQNASCNTHHCPLGGVLLKYIPVTLHGKGRSISTFAFFDGGSTCTLMEHDLWKELDLNGENYPLCINWTAGHGRYKADSVKCSLDIAGYQQGERYHLSKVHTVQSLDLPAQSMSVDDKTLPVSFEYSH